MVHSVVVFNPVYESPPSKGPLWYIEPYYEQIKEYLVKKGIDVAYLHEGDCVRDKTWSTLRAKRRHYFIGVGHGNPTTFTGYQYQPIFWVDMTRQGWSHEWIKNNVILLLSCQTCQRLSPWLDENDAWSVLAWKVSYSFWINQGKRKGKDWRETPEILFFEPLEKAFEKCASAEITPKEAYDYIYKRYTEYMENPEIPDRYKSTLKYDRDGMVLLGKEGHPPDVTPVPPVPPVPPPPPVPAPQSLRGIGLPFTPGFIPLSTNGWIGKLLDQISIKQDGKDISKQFRVLLYDAILGTEEETKKKIEFAIIGWDEVIRDYCFTAVTMKAVYYPDEGLVKCFITFGNTKALTFTIAGKSYEVPPFKKEELELGKLYLEKKE